MPLISLREFARRNGVSAEAISKAVKAGRLPHVDGKIDPGQAQPIWDEVKDRARSGKKIGRGRCQLAQVDSRNPQVDTRIGQVDTQVDSHDPQVDTRAGQVDTRPASRTIAITIQVNGAEYLELLARAGNINLGLPAFVLVQCGLQTWRQEAAHERPAPRPQGRPVRLALERRSITVRVTDAEYEQLVEQAGGARIPQYIRTRCGFQVRNTSLPGTDEREDEADDAWERLQRLGLEPQGYFQAEE